MKQLFAFIKKEFYHVFRDWKTLLLLFGLPVIQIVLFGFALSNEVKNTKIVVCDYAKDAGSQRIIQMLETSNNFEIEKAVMDEKAIEKTFKEGKIKLALLIPANFSEDLTHLNKAQIRIIADASDPNLATTLTNYVTSIIMGYQKELSGNMTIPLQINPEIRMLYNPELKGATNFVPGVMALVLLLVCVLMTSVSIVKEKEMGTMEVLFGISTPSIQSDYCQSAPLSGFLSIINLSVIILLSVTLLGLQINGSLLILFGISILFILCALSIGLLISNVTQSQQIAMLISLLGMLLPTLLLTGFMFPVENMPIALQWISNIVPSKWYYIMIKSIMIKGLGFSAIWKETLILFGMTCFLFFMSIKKFKIRLS